MSAPRVLILGGAGMLGHRLWLHCKDRFETRVTLRSLASQPDGVFDASRVIAPVDADDPGAIKKAIDAFKPTDVVNCIGIVKQLAAAKDPVPSITVNALLPHRVHQMCEAAGARFIHISTDCVFAGDRGGYLESDRPDAGDLYGRSKLLGEVSTGRGLTLRTSIIGRELRSSSGLLEWFLSQRGGTVKGFKTAIFSGVTTHVLSQVIGDVIEAHRGLSGLYHVAAAPVNKLDLLRLLDVAFRTGTTIVPADDVRIDRSLNGARFQAATGWSAPEWPAMVNAAAADSGAYERWRTAVVS